MRIAILSHNDVSGWYAATLINRGHEVIISGGGAVHLAGMLPYLECDGCLLLGDEEDLIEIADVMKRAGRKVWRSCRTYRRNEGAATRLLNSLWFMIGAVRGSRRCCR